MERTPVESRGTNESVSDSPESTGRPGVVAESDGNGTVASFPTEVAPVYSPFPLSPGCTGDVLVGPCVCTRDDLRAEEVEAPGTDRVTGGWGLSVVTDRGEGCRGGVRRSELVSVPVDPGSIEGGTVSGSVGT